jgi:site-specific recombinase XerD
MKRVKYADVISVYFRDLRDEFLTQTQLRNYSYATIDSYRVELNRFLAYLADKGIAEAQDVDINIIDSYRGMLLKNNFKPSSVNMYLKAVKAFFEHLEETGVIFISPASHIRMPRFERKLQAVPSYEEIEVLFNQADITTPVGLRNRAIMETAYSTAMRLGELISMNMESADLINGEIRIIGKGRKERIIPLGSYAVKWIQKYLSEARMHLLKAKDIPALWICCRGKRLSKAALQRMFSDYRKSGNIQTEISAHSLRRACATHMLKNGASAMEIKSMLGHSSYKTLGQYLAVSITELKKMHQESKLGE